MTTEQLTLAEEPPSNKDYGLRCLAQIRELLRIKQQRRSEGQ